MIFSLFIVLLIALVLLLSIYTYLYMKVRLNPKVPTISNALSVFKLGIFSLDFKELLRQITHIGETANGNGGVMKFMLGPIVVYVVSNAEDASVVLNRSLEKSFVYSFIEPYLGSDALVAAKVHSWKKSRRIMDLTFKQNVVDSYMGIFNRQGKRLAEELTSIADKHVDIFHILIKHTSNTVCQTTFGKEINEERIETYAKSADKVFSIMTNRSRHLWLLSDTLFNLSSLKTEQNEAMKIISSMSEEIIQLKKSKYLKRLKHKETNTNDNDEIKSCLDIMVESIVSENGQSITDSQLKSLIDNIMFAGFDTTGLNILFTLLCVGTYPEVQEKIYEEIKYTITDEVITIDDLRKMPYLEAVMKETLRLYPVGPVIGRSTTEDVQLENHIIPRGCQIMIHLWAINRNKLYWGEDADEFKPERWLDSKVPTHPTAYASYAPGRRNCIGKAYSMIMMKTFLAQIIKKFKITADIRKVQFEFIILLKPSSGHLLKLELRDKICKKNQ